MYCDIVLNNWVINTLTDLIPNLFNLIGFIVTNITQINKYMR